MTLPDFIIKYICRDTIRGRNLGFLKVDREGRLVESGGAVSNYLPRLLEKGDVVADKVDFLAGMLPLSGESELLTAIQVDENARQFADAHLISGEEFDWVLLFDSSARAAVDQLLQQRSYEVSLLREELDREKQQNNEADVERKKTRHLLSNLLPDAIIERINRGERDIVEHFGDAALVGFAVDGMDDLTARLGPLDTSRLLGEVFAVVESMANERGANLLKTLGTAVMIGVGLPSQVQSPLTVAMDLALDLTKRFAKVTAGDGEWALTVRAALSCGPMTGGIVGFERFAYEVWGQPVGELGRLLREGPQGQVSCSRKLAKALPSSISAVDGVGWDGAVIPSR